MHGVFEACFFLYKIYNTYPGNASDILCKKIYNYSPFFRENDGYGVFFKCIRIFSSQNISKLHKSIRILCINHAKMHKYSKNRKKADKMLVLFVCLY